MDTKRLLWLDSLKGWLILLVVLGHAIQYSLMSSCENNHLWNIIYSFHMPAFMAVSGYVAFRPGNIMGGGIISLLSKINRRFQQLLVPFFLWSLVSVIIRGKITLDSIVNIILYPDTGLWFLWVLFFISVLFLICDWLSDLTKIKQELFIISFCLLLTCIMVLFEIRILGFQFICYYFLFYTLGYYLHKYKDVAITRKRWLIVILSLCWLFLAWFWNMHSIPDFLRFVPLPEMLMAYAYRFFTAVIAIYILLAISPHVLSSADGFNSKFVWLGKFSLGIYAIHYILIQQIASLFKGFDMNSFITVSTSFVTALFVSIVLVWLISKWKLSARLLLGKV